LQSIKRRKKIENICNQLSALLQDIESVKEEEQDSFDNLPEGIQYSEKGEKMEEYISQMEDAISEIESVSEILEEIFQT
jgi:hypothetical protein